MKKWIGVIVAAVVVLGMAAGFYYLKISRVSMDSILPAGAAVYVHASDIGKDLKNFQSTKLWSNIQGIDVETLMKESGASQADIETYIRIKAQASTAMTGLLLDKFFSREVGLAIYRSEIGSGGSQALLDALSNIVVITRVKPEAQFVEFMTTLYNKFNQQVNTQTEQYKGYTVTTVEADKGIDIAYVKIKDFLVIGFGKKAAYACVDVAAKSRAPLLQDASYHAAQSRLLKAAHLVVYGNLEAVLTDLRRWFEILADGKMAEKEKNQIQAVLYNLAGLKTLGFSSLPGKIAQGKSVLILDKERMNAELLQAYSRKPQANNTINFVPKEALLYHWSNCFNAKQYWGSFTRAMDKEEKKSPDGLSARDRLNDVEKRLGVNIESDVVPLLDNETGGFLYAVDAGMLFPVPKLVFFIKVKDRAAAEKIMDALTADAAALAQTEEYRSVRIKYVSLPLGATLQPGFCFLGDYLLISSSREVLKKSIDAQNDKSLSLAANEDLKTIDPAFTDKGNSVFFAQTDKFLDEVRELCSWGVGMLSFRAAGIQAYQSGIEKKIDDMLKEIDGYEGEIVTTRARIEALNQEIADGLGQGIDVTAKKVELAAAEESVKKAQDEIGVSKEKQQELRETLLESQKRMVRPELVRLYLEEAVYPILDGLKINRATAVKTIFNDGVAETRFFSRVEE
ncbi:MAG TPA: DUF3352 domain-containing protein [Candidatus Omnitrophota bacterium]|nr:DUF3352 domain-containing protein [Candidatus Omnitrophota bacterium]HPD83863.1 DUF3352 domain-containing protein [Candidatus Omnitrophota bacterium]HRZ02720.1 DUF3352 domain-containing protein [Candidatus Omnitrophota bacterium]